MKQQDTQQFFQIWQAAWEQCGKTITPAAMRLAFTVLKKYDIEEVIPAIMRHVEDPTTGMFPPKAADVVRYIDGTAEDQALRAWTQAVPAISGGPRPEDPITNAVINELGGYRELGMGKQELHWVEKQFVRRYTTFIHTPHLADPTGEVQNLIASTVKRLT